MSAAALQAQAHQALRPRGDSRLGLGAALALLAHGGLVGALALGLNWRLPQAPVAASAELWAAVPQAAPAAVAQAAPPPVPVVTPPPAPVPAPPPTAAPTPAAKPQPAPVPPGPSAAERDAAIALERALTRKKELDALATRQAREAAERERLRLADDKAQARQRDLQAKAEKAEKAAEDKRQKVAAEQREKAQKDAEAQAQEAMLAKQREENLKRMLGQAGAVGSTSSSTSSSTSGTGNAARDAAPSAAYAGKIKAFIKPNIRLPVEVTGNPVTEVEVKLAPDGTVISRRVVKPSGNASWDNTVLRAIDITATLPRDSDGRVPPTMLLVFPRQE